MATSLCGQCEHPADQHQMSWGSCEQVCLDPDMGDFFTCLCIHFEKDADD